MYGYGYTYKGNLYDCCNFVFLVIIKNNAPLCCLETEFLILNKQLQEARKYVSSSQCSDGFLCCLYFNMFFYSKYKTLPFSFHF